MPVHWRDVCEYNPADFATLSQQDGGVIEVLRSFVDEFIIDAQTPVCDFMRSRLQLDSSVETRMQLDVAVEQVLTFQRNMTTYLKLGDYMPWNRKFNDAFEGFFYGVRTLQNEHVARRRLAATDEDREDVVDYMSLIVRDVATERSTETASEKAKAATPFQKITCFILEMIHEHGYRRVGEDLYEEIVVDGNCTHAWKKATDIRTFAQKVCGRSENTDMWMALTASKCDNIENVVRYIRSCVDPEAPELKPNREIISFRNGLYYTGQDMVYLYRDKERWKQQAEAEVAKRASRVHRVEMANGDCVQRTMNDSAVFDTPRAPVRSDVAMKYHDCLLPEEAYETPMDIPTPEIEKILNSQNFDDETKYWLYAFLGRCLHEVGINGKDQWQAIAFIKGVAGCGKSTLLMLLKKIFPPHLIANISSNAEEKYTWSAACDAFLFMCMEVRRNCSWNQGELQSIISAEDVPISAKYEKPRTVEWNTPGILAGNEVFDLSDAAGSIRRRIVVWECNNPVPPDISDPQLGEKAARNLGAFVLKINRMYMMLAFLYGHRDIWSKGLMPTALHNFRNKMKFAIDSLAAFMNDRRNQRIEDFWTTVTAEKNRYLAGEIGRDEFNITELLKNGFSIKFSDFAEKYATFLKSKGYKDVRTDGQDQYKLVFSESRFMFFADQFRHDMEGNGNYVMGTYLLGLRST